MKNKYLFQMKLSEILWPNPKKSTKLSLLEMTRAAKEKVELKHLFDDLEDYVHTPAQYFIHFSDLPAKLGINPKSKFSTPIGIYGYPLIPEILNVWRMNKLPFGGDRPYAHIFEIHGNIIELDQNGNSNFSEQDLEAAIQKLSPLVKIQGWHGAPSLGEAAKLQDTIKAHNPYSDTEFNEKIIKLFPKEIRPEIRNIREILVKNYYELSNQYGRSSIEFDRISIKLTQDYKNNLLSYLRAIRPQPAQILINYASQSKMQTPFGRLWNITRLLAGKENPVQWNKILRSLEIDAVVDYGSSLIHPNEPVQAVVLNPKTAEIIETEHNPHGTKPEKQTTQQEQQLIKDMADGSINQFFSNVSYWLTDKEMVPLFKRRKVKKAFEKRLKYLSWAAIAAGFLDNIEKKAPHLASYVITAFTDAANKINPDDYRPDHYSFLKEDAASIWQILFEFRNSSKQTKPFQELLQDKLNKLKEIEPEVKAAREENIKNENSLQLKLQKIFEEDPFFSAMYLVGNLLKHDEREVKRALLNDEVKEAFKELINKFTITDHGIQWIAQIMETRVPPDYYKITAMRVSEELQDIIKNKDNFENDKIVEIYDQLQILDYYNPFAGIAKWFKKELKGEIQF